MWPASKLVLEGTSVKSTQRIKGRYSCSQKSALYVRPFTHKTYKLRTGLLKKQHDCKIIFCVVLDKSSYWSTDFIVAVMSNKDLFYIILLLSVWCFFIHLLLLKFSCSFIPGELCFNKLSYPFWQWVMGTKQVHNTEHNRPARRKMDLPNLNP